MPDVDAARAEIQKVVSLLVNRVGPESEVFAHLTAALGHLREERVRVVAAATPQEAEGAAEESISVPAVEEAAAPPPPGERRKPTPIRRTRR